MFQKVSIYIIIFTLAVLTGCLNKSAPNEDSLNTYKSLILNDNSVSKYITEVKIDRAYSNTLNKISFYDYTLNVSVNNDFDNLSKDEQFYSLLSTFHIIKDNKNAIVGDFSCGEKIVCGFEYLYFISENNKYKLDYDILSSGLGFTEKDDYSLYLVVNESDERYQPQKLF